MILSDIARLRLTSQQLVGTKFTSPKGLVTWMGALQAQDLSMAKWALGIRLPRSSERSIDAALEHGELLRTHLLRPTWHFVSPDDIYWLLELSAPHIVAGERSRDRQLELTEAVYARSNTIIEKAFREGGQLTREQLVAELRQAGFATNQNRASHLLMRAELEKIICSGAYQNGKPTYALLPERVPHPRLLPKEEALAELARRYFTSRAPASLQDFTWWSGLPAGEARLALDMVKPQLACEVINSRTYWLVPGQPALQAGPAPLQLLPTYDEYILSYKDRSASIAPELEQHMKEISDRGVFWPVIVVNGQVCGVWKRTLSKKDVLVELRFFAPPNPDTGLSIREVLQKFALFIDKELAYSPPNSLNFY